jgi:cytochrome c-type biogenesis protein CcmH/NrfF
MKLFITILWLTPVLLWLALRAIAMADARRYRRMVQADKRARGKR